jgi:tetratricopeptide (TPR) repeat protein
MQVPVLDRAAVEFARAFYAALAAGEPAESALATARRSVTRANRAAGADWSIPAVFMGTDRGIELDLPAPPFRLPLPLDLSKRAFLGFVSLIGIIATLVAIPDTAAQVRTRVPVVKCVWPYEMQATADRFNVAVAPFMRLDATGRVVRDGEGAALAGHLFGLLEREVAAAELADIVKLRAPGQGCPLRGATAEERAASARELARRINANVVVYGVIADTADGPRFYPEFFVDYRGFEQASEVTGSHELGRPVPVSLPIDIKDFQGGGHPLQYRTRALSLITLGLAAYARDDFDAAARYFEDAAERAQLVDGEGREIAYLLLGNAYLRRAGNERDPQWLDPAEAAFAAAQASAAAAGQTFARADLGAANALYARALGNPMGKLSSVEPALLDQAEAAYKAALDLPAPASANIAEKVALYLAQVYILRHVLTQDPLWLDRAEASVSEVMAAYEASEGGRRAALAYHAAEAYAMRGTIADRRGDLDAAAGWYLKAAELASPARKVLHLLALGDLRKKAGDADAARRYYDQGLEIARYELRDPKLIERAQSRLSQLTQGDS